MVGTASVRWTHSHEQHAIVARDKSSGHRRDELILNLVDWERRLLYHLLSRSPNYHVQTCAATLDERLRDVKWFSVAASDELLKFPGDKHLR